MQRVTYSLNSLPFTSGCGKMRRWKGQVKCSRIGMKNGEQGANKIASEREREKEREREREREMRVLIGKRWNTEIQGINQASGKWKKKGRGREATLIFVASLSRAHFVTRV